MAYGIFISKDPIGFYDGPNRYSYVGNNPVNWVDPWGLRSEKEDWYYQNIANPFKNYGGGAPPNVGGGGASVPVISAPMPILSTPTTSLGDYDTKDEEANEGANYKKGDKCKFKGGKKGKRDPELRGKPREFKRWFHREKREGDPDSSYKEVQDAYNEWINQGKPNA